MRARAPLRWHDSPGTFHLLCYTVNYIDNMSTNAGQWRPAVLDYLANSCTPETLELPRLQWCLYMALLMHLAAKVLLRVLRGISRTLTAHHFLVLHIHLLPIWS